MNKCVFGIHKYKHTLPNNTPYLGSTKKTKWASHLFHISLSHAVESTFSSADINTHTHKDFVLPPKLNISLPRTVFSVLLISVRNHTVHLIGQIVFKARNGLTGPASYEVSGGALHLVQAHVARLRDLPLGKVHKLRIPGIDAETL